VDISAFQKLDRIIHEKGRLAIMSVLAPAESLTFRELKELLDMTDGNLSVHMRTLEEAAYVRVTKDFVDRKPRSTYALTPEGRAAFAQYIEALEAIIASSRATQPAPAKRAAASRPRHPTPATD
jgi:DNA-binding MarR family transcriptional regulator